MSQPVASFGSRRVLCLARRSVFFALLLATTAWPSAAGAQVATVPTAALADQPAVQVLAPPSQTAPASTAVASPTEFFGFRMGDDGRLADWPAIERYFALVAEASDRVQLVTMGESTEGRRMIAALISAPENIARLDEIQAVNRRLADPRGLSPEDIADLAASHPVVVALGCSVHASEIGATQMANELLYELATGDAPETRRVLRDVVVALIPSLNPDGHELVVDWDARTRGTPFANAPMPWLYHQYAGHDVNRDAFMLNLAESRVLADFFYRRWHPQVFLTLHQMGPRGARFFVPPNYDPIDPNSDPLLWRTAGLLGHAMSLALEREGREGVVQNALFDYYSPGYEDSAPLGHNTVCLLSEAASARLADPLHVSREELTSSPRGLPDHRPQVNFPNPWPGGTWRLRDVVEYELTAVRGLLSAASRYRFEIVDGFVTMGRRAVEAGTRGGPFAFVIPPDQFDPHAAAALQNVLIGGAVEIERALEPFEAGVRTYPAGTAIVPMAQPFRAYVKTLLERQEYPVRRRTPEAPPERPYDVAGWTLPLQMGVAVDQIDEPFALPRVERVDQPIVPPGAVTGESRPTHYLVDARGTGGALAANRLVSSGLEPGAIARAIEADDVVFAPGSLVVRASHDADPIVRALAAELGLRVVGRRGALPLATPVAPRRIGLHKPWVASIDEGWTRLLLERYGFGFESVTDLDVRRGDLRRVLDVLVLPDAPRDVLLEGHRPGSVPPEYAGGLGADGLASLRRFVEDGGTLVCLDTSCDLVIEALDLPVKNVASGLPPETFFCPGSLIRLEVDTTHPLGHGLPERTAAFFSSSAAYDVTAPEAASIVARYGRGQSLLSGWLEGPQVVSGRAAVVEATRGRGRVVLLGFRVQHRAQSLGTFRLLFNALR